MQPKVELNKVRAFGDTVDDSILFLKQNIKPLLKAYVSICGVFWLGALVMSTVNQFHSFKLIKQGESIFSTTYLIALLFELLNYVVLILTTVSYVALYHHKDKQPPTVEEVWGYVKFYFIRVFLSFIALSLLLIPAFMFCLMPGIYLWPIFSLVLTIMIIENASLGYAFNRAFKLVNDNWWHTFGILIVIILLIMISLLLLVIPASAITMAYVFISGKSEYSAYEVAVNIAMHLGHFTHVLLLIAITMVYYSLTEQKDDVTLLQRIQNFGQHATPAQQPDNDEEY